MYHPFSRWNRPSWARVRSLGASGFIDSGSRFGCQKSWPVSPFGVRRFSAAFVFCFCLTMVATQAEKQKWRSSAALQKKPLAHRAAVESNVKGSISRLPRRERRVSRWLYSRILRDRPSLIYCPLRGECHRLRRCFPLTRPTSEVAAGCIQAFSLNSIDLADDIDRAGSSRNASISTRTARSTPCGYAISSPSTQTRAPPRRQR